MSLPNLASALATALSFTPVAAEEKKIHDKEIQNGNLYFATDSGRIYLDMMNERKSFGGQGVSVLYASGSAQDIVEDTSNFTYYMNFEYLNDKNAEPKKDDLIINKDGRFFKILDYNKQTKKLHMSLIAVSGSGGGGGGGSSSGGAEATLDLKCTGVVPNSQIYIYGKSQWVEFTATALKDGVVTFTFIITSVTTKESRSFSYTQYSGQAQPFDLGANLFHGLNTLKVSVTTGNSGSDTLNYENINSISLALKPSKDFNPLRYAYDDKLTFFCIPEGQVDKTLQIYINGAPEDPIFLNATVSDQTKGVDIAMREHGVYKLKAELEYSTGVGEPIPTDPLEYEIAFVNSTKTAPLIWFDQYPTTIVDHDKLSIKFMVYDPVSPAKTTVRRYINGNEITPLEDIAYSDSKWIVWNISNYRLGKNTFALQCGNTTREISVYVEEDTVRNLNLITAGLYLNLNTLDRSNKENPSSREKWEYEHPDGSVTAVKFNNFNWYNNGWLNSNEIDNSILRISNGASIEIPLSIMNTTKLQNSLTFELRFKLRNVKKYENLITTTTIEDKDNVDEFGNPAITVIRTPSFDKGVWGRYANNAIGMCLGTQEGFFTGSNATVSGRYKEDQIITVSFVLEAKTTNNAYPLIYMYIDGVLSSIIEYKDNESFKSDAEALIINSDYCDVDLLNIRVYKAALSSSEIVQNYLADRNDAVLYDMNQIITYKNNIPTVDFAAMIKYNEIHPDQLLQPYAILECVDKTEDKLPYVKGGKKKLNVTFVNPTLDKAYADNLISDEEYLCGAPSFYGTNIEFDVQGTSSQGYPRRNYKSKFKKADDNSWVYTSGPLKGKEIGQKQTLNGVNYKGFYMDNTYSETTFTWKADYMESSMTHNTGFASFVNTLYDQHPLKDYDASINTTNRRTTIYGFPMLVFHKTAQINEKGEPIYEFVGRYNFNLDKGCNNVIGFSDEHAHPFIDGTFTSDGQVKPLDFAHIAECWEVKHNQGGRVAFVKSNFDEVDESGKLTVLNDFEVRYNYYDKDIENAMKGLGNFESQNQAQRNEYLLSKYANLEKVVNWLVSTDTVPVSGENYVASLLPEPVTFNDITYEYDNREYRLAKFQNEFSKHFNKHYCAIYFIMTELLIQYDSRGKNMMLGTWGPQAWKTDIDGNILTDDNGKKISEDYIWYPIFYDIDTQLGVNNSGVPSWEYYDEPTKQGDFSTSNSVLWNNFYECFYDTIVDTYSNLRKNNLTYEKLNGYYTYNYEYINYTGIDNKTHNSYAMRGHRPINIINIDQYFKYIAPTFNGYVDTSGNIALDEGKRFYCLQGNRDLHRELFLRNRFNFMDSAWLGGSYNENAIKQEFQIRCNANRYSGQLGEKNTSDRFLARQPSEAEKLIGFDYDPENPLNAEWTWNIVPYLRQYVSIQYDDIVQRPPVEYPGDEKPIAARYNESNEKSIQEVASFGQQLSYIGGAEYISSLGDMSLKYPDEVYLTKLKRLKDIRLGNDTTGFSNNALTTCILGASAITPDGLPNENAKNLLESVVLTGVNSLSGSLDLSGSEKLKEFRALRTNITGVDFADGVQAEIVHLPNTIKQIKFIEPTNLQNILTETVASGVDPETGYNIYPQGLYVQGVTDSELADTTLIDKYIITGGNMGYDSYQLLQNLVEIKTKMQNTENLDSSFSKNLAISLDAVDWSPYRLVIYGEEVNKDKNYKIVTENSTLEDYVPGEHWDIDTLNGLIYEVNTVKEASKHMIKNLDLIDLFLDETKNLSAKNVNYFTDIIEYSDNRITYPNITGNIYIDNDESNPISDYEIRTFYNIKYPELTIFANYTTPAYTIKFVEITEEGQTKVLDTGKYRKENDVHPTMTSVIPSKLHYDFLGWTTNPNYDIVDENGNLDLAKVEAARVTTDENGIITSVTLSDQNPVEILYAMYFITNYKIYYHDHGANSFDKYEVEPIMLPYGSDLVEPTVIPYRGNEESKLEDARQRLAFKGWTLDDERAGIVNAADLKALQVNLNDFVADKEYHFYALFVQENVYDNATDYKYFDINNGVISILDDYRDGLKGRITLPSIDKDGAPIVKVGDFKDMPYITHVFFKPDSTYTEIAAEAFYRSNNIATSLVMVELRDTVKVIGKAGFGEQFKLQEIIMDGVTHIGDEAFKMFMSGGGVLALTELPPNLVSIGNEAFYNTSDNITIANLPNSVETLGDRCFFDCNNIRIKEFGSDTTDKKLHTIGTRAFAMLSSVGDHTTVDQIDIYASVKVIKEGAFSQYGAASGVIGYITPGMDTSEFSLDSGLLSYEERD